MFLKGTDTGACIRCSREETKNAELLGHSHTNPWPPWGPLRGVSEPAGPASHSPVLGFHVASSSSNPPQFHAFAPPKTQSLALDNQAPDSCWRKPSRNPVYTTHVGNRMSRSKTNWSPISTLRWGPQGPLEPAPHSLCLKEGRDVFWKSSQTFRTHSEQWTRPAQGCWSWSIGFLKSFQRQITAGTGVTQTSTRPKALDFDELKKGDTPRRSSFKRPAKVTFADRS